MYSLFPSPSCPDLKDSSPSSWSTSPTSPAVLSPISNSHNQWFTKQRSQRSPKPNDHHTSSPSNRKRSPASDLPEIRYLRRIDCNDNIDRIKQSPTEAKIRIDDFFIEQTVPQELFKGRSNSCESYSSTRNVPMSLPPHSNPIRSHPIANMEACPKATDDRSQKVRRPLPYSSCETNLAETNVANSTG